MSTEEDREAIAGEISGVQVGVGYESTTIGITAALEAADLLIAAGFHRTPAPASDVQIRAEAERQYPLPPGRTRGDGTAEGVAQRAFEKGVEWATARVSAPQITDEMVKRGWDAVNGQLTGHQVRAILEAALGARG